MYKYVNNLLRISTKQDIYITHCLTIRLPRASVNRVLFSNLIHHNLTI